MYGYLKKLKDLHMKTNKHTFLNKLLQFSGSLFLLLFIGLISGCSATDDTDTAATAAFTVSDWTSSGVLEASIDLVTTEQTSLTNS